MEQPCPYCGALLQSWRFSFAAEATETDKAAALANNPGLELPHALLHIPEGY
jgi:hypothetical protein